MSADDNDDNDETDDANDAGQAPAGPAAGPAARGPLRIRLARPAEAPLLIGFQASMARETEGLELDRGVLGRGVRAVFDDPTLGEYWVAEVAGEVAGCMLVTREWSDWRNGSVLWLQSVYVVPDRRGQGIYRALHAQLRRRVETTPDLRGIRLYVDRRNRGAQRTYERVGMDGEHYTLYEWMK